jgi:hypothetical protein
MILTTESRNITLVNATQSRSFGLDLRGGHLMTILSDLYANRVLAIVREYMTNMLDGYVGMDPAQSIPPVVTLPTPLSPYIEFKDFGCGMSFDTVWNVFTQYGASTKRENNDAVGGLGLGCKTAFCYAHADQWTIETRFRGEKHIFAATKGPDGVPQLIHLSTVASDEPSGVSIKIPVAGTDVEAFHKHAATMAKYYPMPVTLKNLSEGHVCELTADHRGSSWAMSFSRSWGRTLTVVMGNVPYKIGVHEAGLDYNAVTGVDLTLWVPIGAVDIVPSRESLKHTERTKSAIKAAYEAFQQEMSEMCSALIVDAATEWEAMTTLEQLSRVHAIEQALQSVEWRGTRLSPIDGLKVSIPDVLKLAPDTRVWRLSKRTSGAKIQRTDISTMTTLSLSPRSTGVVVLDELPGLGIMRRLNEDDPIEEKEVGYIVRGTGITQEQLAAAFKGAPITLASTLSEPVRLPSSRKSTKAPPSIRVLEEFTKGRGYWNRKTSHRFSAVTSPLPTDQTIYYVLLNGVQPMNGAEPTNLASLLLTAKNAKLVSDTVQLFGIPKTASRDIPESWVNFDVYLREQVLERRLEIEEYIRRVDAFEAALKTSDNEKVLDFYERLRTERITVSPEATALLQLRDSVNAQSKELKGLRAIAENNRIPLRHRPTGDLELTFKHQFRQLRVANPAFTAMAHFDIPYRVAEVAWHRLKRIA